MHVTGRTLKKIAAGATNRILAEQGISKDKPVAVLVDEDMAEISQRIRTKAKASDMTDKVFEDLTKDL
jgi:ribosomal protein S13